MIFVSVFFHLSPLAYEDIELYKPTELQYPRVPESKYLKSVESKIYISTSQTNEMDLVIFMAVFYSIVVVNGCAPVKVM